MASPSLKDDCVLVHSSPNTAQAADDRRDDDDDDDDLCRQRPELELLVDRRRTHIAWSADAEATTTAERRHALPVAVPPAAAAQSRTLSALHPLDGPRRRHLQAGRHQVRLASVGPVQETAVDELRNHGTSAEVLTTILGGGSRGQSDLSLIRSVSGTSPKVYTWHGAS